MKIEPNLITTYHKICDISEACFIGTPVNLKNETNTFSNGCLGSHNDEERSEMRYVMRIAKSSESSKL